AGAAIPTLGLSQSGRGGKPDLVLSSAAEPPDFERAGGQFRVYLTVVNQGRKRAKSSRARLFLSTDATPGTGDVALATTRVAAVARRRQRTRQVTAVIPANTPPALYHLIVCADVTNAVKESKEGNNCHVSGQQIGVDTVVGVRGAPGPDGPPGETGPAGDKGQGFGLIEIPRTELTIGEPNVDDEEAGQDPPAEVGDGVPDEGSTVQKDLITVGPITLRAMCVKDANQFKSDENTIRTDGKILVIHDEGTVAFRGTNGVRGDIPPISEAVPGADGRNGGDGKRQIVAVEGASDGTDRRFRSAAGGFLVHSGGTHISLHGLYAAIGTAGGDADKCTFGGLIRVVTP
ncbi:MAG TPA: CARDB domain-containing protein, partial [Solirubrobacteraceae bacterium]